MFGADGAQRDGVYPDSGGTVVDGGCPGETLDRGFGGGVGGRAPHGPLRLMAGDVHNRPALADGEKAAGSDRAGSAAAASLIYASPTMSLAARSAGPRPHTRHVPSSSLTSVRNVTVVA
ncbi:hypothetical protein GCM10009626_32840 [Brachybacterium sacelli]